MKFANATKLDRKSGVAQWRDPRFNPFVLSDLLAFTGRNFGLRRLLRGL
jgi:hypothetical protein